MANFFTDGLIFLMIVCILVLAASLCFNFLLLVTSLKLRRIRHTDKSNYFLSHLFVGDFLCSFFVLIPSAYGIYNNSSLDLSWCHVQTYFSTLSNLITFHGLLALSCERLLKFTHPDKHIAYFSTEAKPSSLPACTRVSCVLLPIWIIDIFFAFIPLFGNSSDQKYYLNESQCDYSYENFQWWLIFYFVLAIALPFLVTLIIFIIVLRIIHVQKKKVIENKQKHKIGFLRKKININKIKENAENLQVYSIEPAIDGKFSNDDPNSAFAKKKLLNQFKYKTDKKKTVTFSIITIISFILVVPVFVLHFYRAFNNVNNLPWQLYTTLVWISYCNLFIKPLLCIATNSYYRSSIKQAAQIRGFHGNFNYSNEEILRR
jgi:hypothetical protein